MYSPKTVEEAIKNVVTYQTLPPQIDYRVPYRLKAIAAEKFLENQPDEVNEAAQKEIEKQLDDYEVQEYYNSLM